MCIHIAGSQMALVVNGNPHEYSCLGNPMDGGSWKATVHRVTKSQIQLKQFSTHKAIMKSESNSVLSDSL